MFTHVQYITLHYTKDSTLIMMESNRIRKDMSCRAVQRDEEIEREKERERLLDNKTNSCVWLDFTF